MNDGSPQGYERLLPEWLQSELRESIFSSRIVYYETLDSTNNLAWQMASEGAPEGTLVLAEEQTAGKGRRGKSWVSPAGANLLFSVLLRPPIEGDRVFSLTMVLSLAALKALKAVSGVRAMIKWPNDVYVGARKLAGILTEFSVQGKNIQWAVLGMGINVAWHPEMTEGSGAQATSILEETGQRISRNELLIEIMTALEALYSDVVAGSMKAIHEEWSRNCFVLGKAVVVESDKERIEGRALRIDDFGALIIEDADGHQRKVLTGDVSLRVASLTAPWPP